ncbi:glycoside hydrolase [Lojkania enalia]|uniref:beta-N-acetylhexosaminidase n=1 Tax=Lojkania enalia TaxID=147567 RepID=A0A9P4KBE3_9PLEO|nr:glycoside hydrolase [Didymosphaeria enalia]
MAFNSWGWYAQSSPIHNLLMPLTARLLGIPTLPFTAADGQFRLRDTSSIVVDVRFAKSVNNAGETLVPPTLEDFARTFARDLVEVGVETPVRLSENPENRSLFLTLTNTSDYRDAAGRPSSEGYTLTVSSSGINITGASPLGVWWGTRTILQQAILFKGLIPWGVSKDTPGWGTRGMMLDVGRHYYPPSFLVEMCAYMSFFKQNTFHLHLSDNLYNNVRRYDHRLSLELYARFRLWSDSDDVAGLNKHKNESYTRAQFDHIQYACAARGVTIIPEIEALGHALVFVQWKPELGLSDDLSLLNISNPATIPTMRKVWTTFLPWFHSKIVHIGADEYTAEVNDYNAFVNAMADHIHTESNKSTRIWGTFPPNYIQPGYINIYQNVSIQHWEFFEGNPLNDYIRNNYTVLNSDDTFYVVNKWSGSYPQEVNIARTFNGDPSGKEPWYPHIFDTQRTYNNPPRDEPLVLGEVAPLWNDYGPNSSVYSEAYYAWREGIPALADKQWGGDLTMSEFNTVLKVLHPIIPDQNLERRIPSRSPTILDYSLDRSSVVQVNRLGKILDLSGNGHDGWSNCSTTSNDSIAINSSCMLTTPLSSKGRDYTLSLGLLLRNLDNPTNSTILSGADSSLMLTPSITLFASGEYFRLRSTLPKNQRVELSIIARGRQTFAKINDGQEEEFLTKMGVNGERFEWGPMAIEAPLKEMGGKGCGWSGEIWSFKLTNVTGQA